MVSLTTPPTSLFPIPLPKTPLPLPLPSPPHLSFSSSFPISPNPLHSSFSSTPSKIKRLGFHHSTRCSSTDSYYFNNNSINGEEEQVLYPRPSEIPWNKELCNSVHLLGVVGTPVQIKHLSSGKVLAWTRLGVRKSATDTTWINLTFWNELAQIAFQHLEKGNRIYVSGRLVSDTVDGDGEKPQTYYKVVVQQLNFVENTLSPVSLYEPDTSSRTTGGQVGNYAGKSKVSSQELWQAFFANPVDWWDNRKNKRSMNYPDFKHKHTGEALWVEGKYNPPWVKSQLAILDSRLESLHTNEASSGVSYMSGDDLTLY